MTKLLETEHDKRDIPAMNKHLWKEQLTPYETDYARWCTEQSALLRGGRFADLDRDNLAEEIESLGRSDRREIENRLQVLLVHLLKLRFQPVRAKAGWKSTIVEQRARIARLLRESPSLKPYPASVLVDEYGYARTQAAAETRLSLDTFPQECPFTIEQILSLDFYP